MSFLALTLTATLAATPAGAPVLQESPAVVIRAEHVHTGTGAVLSPGMVLVRDGKIAEVGAQVKTDGLAVLEFDGHLSAGMVALGDQSLLGEQGVDTTRFVLGEAETRLGFDPRQPAMQRLAREGVTTVVLTPPSHSLVAGRGLITKTGTGRVLAQGQAMHVAFDANMFVDRADPAEGTDFGGGFFFFFGPNGAVNPNGFKSSYSGAAEVLEENVLDAKSPVSKIANGQVTAWLRSNTRAEASRAIAFAKRHKVKGTLEGGVRVGDLAPEIKAAGLGVSLSLFRETNPHFATQSAVALTKAGVPFGFTLSAKDRPVASLRMAAALCRRAGMTAEQSWKALTSGAAQAVGLDKQVGTIQKGLDADLVLWSGQPGELTSQVLQVWVDGQSVSRP